MPYQGKAKTGGGLFIPDEIREREAVATVVAYVMRVGPMAYKDPTSLDLTQSRGASKVNGFALVAMLDLVLKLMVAKFVS